MKKKVYLASPYGFSESTKMFMNDTLIPLLKRQGYDILNPWDIGEHTAKDLLSVSSTSDFSERQAAYAEINRRIGQQNEIAIRQSDLLVAVLDGQEVDSGVAAEVGFAHALSKKVIGYRGDFRLSGENIGARVNLQVQYFIEKSGGKIALSLRELETLLEEAKHT